MSMPDRLSRQLPPVAPLVSVTWPLFLLAVGRPGSALQFLLYLRDIEGTRLMRLPQGFGLDTGSEEQEDTSKVKLECAGPVSMQLRVSFWARWLTIARASPSWPNTVFKLSAAAS